MSAGALTTALQRMPDPRRALVWRDGLADWCEAASLPELWPSPSPAASAPAEDPVDALEQTVAVYRQLVLLVGGVIAAGITRALFRALVPPALDVVVEAGFAVAATGLLVFLSLTAYQLARRLDAPLPGAWALAIWIPGVNLIVLFLLSQKAQAWCTRHGIAVGLLGPYKGALDWMRG